MAGKAVSLRELANVYLPEAAPADRLLSQLPLLRIALGSLAVTNSSLVGFAAPDDVAVWVRRLNTLLRSRSAGTRRVGAVALGLTLPYCHEDTFAANAVSWTKQATHLVAKDGEATVVAALAIIRQSVRRSRLHPELRRSHAADALPNLLSTLLGILGRAGTAVSAASSTEDRQASATPTGNQRTPSAPPPHATIVHDVLNTVAECAQHYPGPTRTVGEKLRRAVVRMLDSPNPQTTVAAATCLAALPCAAATTAQPEAWADAFVTVLGQLHGTVARLYDGADEREVWHRVGTAAPGRAEQQMSTASGGGAADATVVDDADVEVQGDDEVAVLTALIRRFAAQMCWLQRLLQQRTDVAVRVPVEAVLGVALRVVETGGDTLGSSRRHGLLQPLLPELHRAAVELALALVTLERVGVRRHATTVLRVATTALGTPTAAVRVRGFELCTAILQEGGPAVQPTTLDDVVAAALVVTAADDSPDKFDRVAARGNQLAGTSKAGPTPAEHADRISVCRAALITLEAAVLVSGAELRVDTRDRLDAFLLRTALLCGRNPPAPYGDVECRLTLYRAFRAAVLTGGIGQTTMLPHAVTLAAALQHDDASDVRAFGRECTAMFDQMVRPRITSVRRKPTAAAANIEHYSTANNAAPMESEVGRATWGLIDSVGGMPVAPHRVSGSVAKADATGTARTAIDVEHPAGSADMGNTPVLVQPSWGLSGGMGAAPPTSRRGGAATGGSSASTVSEVAPHARPEINGGSVVTAIAPGNNPAKRKWGDHEPSAAATAATAFGEANVSKQARVESKKSTAILVDAANKNETEREDLPLFPDDGPDSDDE